MLSGLSLSVYLLQKLISVCVCGDSQVIANMAQHGC